MSFIGFDEDISIDINDLDPWAQRFEKRFVFVSIFIWNTTTNWLVFEGVEGRIHENTRDIYNCYVTYIFSIRPGTVPSSLNVWGTRHSMETRTPRSTYRKLACDVCSLAFRPFSQLTQQKNNTQQQVRPSENLRTLPSNQVESNHQIQEMLPKQRAESWPNLQFFAARRVGRLWSDPSRLNCWTGSFSIFSQTHVSGKYALINFKKNILTL